MIKRFAQYARKSLRFDPTTKRFNLIEEAATKVRVLAIVEGYAMVRHPRCMPFVVDASTLIFEEKDRQWAVDQREKEGAA